MAPKRRRDRQRRSLPQKRRAERAAEATGGKTRRLEDLRLPRVPAQELVAERLRESPKAPTVPGVRGLRRDVVLVRILVEQIPKDPVRACARGPAARVLDGQGPRGPGRVRGRERRVHGHRSASSGRNHSERSPLKGRDRCVRGREDRAGGRRHRTREWRLGRPLGTVLLVLAPLPRTARGPRPSSPGCRGRVRRLEGRIAAPRVRHRRGRWRSALGNPRAKHRLLFGNRRQNWRGGP